MKKAIFTLIYIFATIGTIFAQQQAIGNWRSHLSYHNVTYTEPAGEIIYALGNNGLFSYNTDDTSIQCYEKANPLTDTEITHIAYSKEYKTLVIMYSDYNIDFLVNNRDVYNLPDYMNKDIKNKDINHVYLTKEYAYLATSFGVIILNLKKREITNAYVLNKKVNSCTVDDEKIYAATDEGLFTGILTDNLLDISNWKKVSDTSYTYLSMYNDNLIGYINPQGIYLINKQDYSYSLIGSGYFNSMKIYADKLIASNNNSAIIFNNLNNKKYFNSKEFEIAHLSYYNGTYWAGGYEDGLMKLKINESNNLFEAVLSNIIPNSPIRNLPYFIKFEGERMFVTGGGLTSQILDNKGTIMTFENNTWDYFQEDGITEVTGLHYRNITSIVEDPRDRKHHFASSAGQGLYEFYDNQFVKLYGLDNSTLESALPDSQHKNEYVWVNGLVYDNNQNLWMLNCTPYHQIHILDRNNKWIPLGYAERGNPLNFECALIDRRGWLWAAATYQQRGGLFCLDHRETLEDPSDDQHKFYTKYINQDGTILDYSIYCLAEDKDGVIWIGSSQGPLVVTNPSKVFKDEFYFTQIKIPRNDGTNLADFLLANTLVKTIAIDGANRKWIGTEHEGVYLLSQDGMETIHHFTAENSPLLSNSISSIAINPHTGEVFIGTSKGLISYQSDATEGGDQLSEDAYAYPNPVKSDYTGVITVTGLVRDTDVKITNTSGKLIYSGTSVGGQFTWNGRNLQGNKVASGIYFVLAADKDGKQGIATKIVIIR